MKLNKNLLNRCYQDTVITQYKEDLENNGFTVYMGHLFSNMQVDLYAEKADEKRVYEFKMVGNQNHNKGQITKFKDFVMSHGATPYVVYVNPPEEKQIQFDGLDELILNYFNTKEFPPELGKLSTHISITSVYVSDLTKVDVSDGTINIDGFATLSVELQYGSNSDFRRGDGVSSTDRFPMSFSIKLRHNNGEYVIENIEYHIDTSSWSD